jgi:serine/threonine protein kinase/WD40 repeat protein
MSEPNQSLEEFLFEAALAKPSPEERAAFLVGVCRDRPELRARLEVLLEGHSRSEGFLGTHAKTVEQKTTPPAAEAASTVSGRYKLLEKIGEGGFGEVWMAQQTEPVKRRVALKIIKLGMDTKQVVARFEAERQALALMDHPNIAKVLDGGATDTGRPYFVMELVRGVRITEYCDQNQVSTQERLKLFIQVCHAVQHAHQKGVIHRDLKPSNILVTLHDGVPVPKIIDFGIAKATQQELTDKTVFTQFRQFLGTPAYVSPEQAEMSGLDIDTRSDIYSLGVLLYELLTGKTPFDPQELLKAGLEALRQTIREQQPLPPSTRLSGLDKDDLTTTAKRRGAEAPKLISLVRGDLDWIVMKCLEKDRARRYDTASGLARDLERHLNNEPIVARPPSRLYELQKTLRRHWVGFTAVGAVVAALAIGVVASTFQTVRARLALAEKEKQKALAQGLLYKSLVGEAQATRLARHVGYREKAFALLQQARALDVPGKNLGDLRKEAVACLGDFVGLTPLTLSDFPTNVTEGCLDPAGKVAAFRLWDGTIELRETASGGHLARLSITNGAAWGVRFNRAGDQLVGVVGPMVITNDPLQTNNYDWRIWTWVRDTDDQWRQAQNRAMPGCIPQPVCTDEGVFVVAHEHGWDPRGPVFLWIKPGGPAEKSHLQVGDRVVSFGGTLLSNTRLPFLVQKSAGQPTSIIVERDGQRIETTITPEVDHATQRSSLGVMVGRDSEAVFRLFNVGTGAFVPGCAVTNTFPAFYRHGVAAGDDGALLAVETGPRGGPNFSTIVNLYDWKTGNRVNQLRLSEFEGASFSPDGKYFGLLGWAATVYAVSGLEKIGQFGGGTQDERTRVMRFARNTVAVPFARRNCIRLWNLVSREEVAVLEEPQSDRSALDLASEGSVLLATGPDHVRLYRLSTPEKLSLPAHTAGVGPVTFSPDGTRLASAADRVVRVCDALTGHIIWETNDLPGPSHALCYSPNGQWLATGDWSTDLVSIRDAHTGRRLLDLGTNGVGRTWSVAFSPSGSYLATATEPYGLRIWTIAASPKGGPGNGLEAKLVKSWTGPRLVSAPGEASSPTPISPQFAPDGRSVAFWCLTTNVPSGRAVFVWDFEGSARPRIVAADIPPSEPCECFTPDGRSLVTVGTNGVLVAVDVASGKQTPFSHGPQEEPNAPGLCLSPDGSKLAVSTPSRLALSIREAATGKLLISLPPEPGGIFGFAWSPDSRRLAVSRDNGNIGIWDLDKVNQILAELGLNP